MRRLDSLVAEPALLPAPSDSSHAAVLEAERWGEEVLSACPDESLTSLACRTQRRWRAIWETRSFRFPACWSVPRFPVLRMRARNNKANEETAQPTLPNFLIPRSRRCLDRDQILGHGHNAADLQIGSTSPTGHSATLPADRIPPAAKLTRYFPANGGRGPRRRTASLVVLLNHYRFEAKQQCFDTWVQRAALTTPTMVLTTNSGSSSSTAWPPWVTSCFALG